MLVIDIMLSRAINIKCDDPCLSCLVTIMRVVHFLVFIDSISTNIMVSLASGLLHLMLVCIVVGLSACWSFCLILCVYLYICPSVRLPSSPSVRPFVCPSACLPARPPVCPPAGLPVRPSACLSVCLVSLSAHMTVEYS